MYPLHIILISIMCVAVIEVRTFAPPTVVRAVANTTIVLLCRNNQGNEKVQWLHKSKGDPGTTFTTLTDGWSVNPYLPFHDRLQLLGEEGSEKYDLQISNVDFSDAGLYSCTVESADKTLYYSSVLRIGDRYEDDEDVSAVHVTSVNFGTTSKLDTSKTSGSMGINDIIYPSSAGGVAFIVAITVLITVCYKRKRLKKAKQSATNDEANCPINSVVQGEPLYDTVDDSPKNETRQNNSSVVCALNIKSSVLPNGSRVETSPHKMQTLNAGNTIPNNQSVQHGVLENAGTSPYSSLLDNKENSTHIYQKLAKGTNQNSIDMTPHIYDECCKNNDLYQQLQKKQKTL